MVKERPIPFNSEMVKAILEGRKTMTRRTRGLKEVNKDPNAWFDIPEQVEGNLWRFFNTNSTTLIVKCPYGQVGDRLFMPRWASRILLEIIGVRVERLQEITVGDCLQEGAKSGWYEHGDQYLDWFESLWDSLNAKRGFPWSSNPWVWVVGFRKL